MLAFYRQFKQGLSVAVCATMSAGMVGYILYDVHRIEKKKIKYTYEKQIKVLNEEIERFRQIEQLREEEIERFRQIEQLRQEKILSNIIK